MAQPLPGMWFCRMGPDGSVTGQGMVGNQTGIELYMVRMIKPDGPPMPSIHIFRLAEMVSIPGSEFDPGAFVFFDTEADLRAWVDLLKPKINDDD